MRIDELGLVCQQAARDIVQRAERRPIDPAVVLPLPTRTRVVALPDFPDDDPGRFDVVARFVADEMLAELAPAWGFVAEASLEAGEDVVVVVYGARRHAMQVAAAPLRADGVGEFTPAEEADPTAFPFLTPLQHAANHVPPDGGPGPLPGGGLPIVS